MKDLAQLKEKILQDLHEEYTHKLSATRHQEEERVNAENMRLEEELVADKQAYKKLAKQQYEREQQSIINASKKQLLETKRTLLEQVYAASLEVMTNWQGETLVGFINGVLEKLNLSGEYELVFGEITKVYVTDEVLWQLTAIGGVSISEEVLPKKAGFIVRQSGVDYNFIYSELLADLKQEFSPVLAKKAFE